jgi:Bacterial Ig domain
MSFRHVPLVGALAALGLSLVGCFDFGPHYRQETWDPPPAATPTATPVSRPPTIDGVGLAKWPPVGKSGAVKVTARDPDGNLSSIRFQFANSVARSAGGALDVASASGEDLGEGFGLLTITALDTHGNAAQRTVNGFLVDLTPPKIVLGQTVLPADGDLELWVGDAWILGKVELAYAGTTMEQDFEPGFPDTVGQTWDYSLVKFPLSQLPAGDGAATVTATDAAGNAATASFVLVVDGDPPSVSIDAPADGATVNGAFTVSLSASDPGGGPVWTSVSLGGTPIGNASSAKASLEVSTKDFATGPSDLVVVATDRAGNQSTAKIVVDLQ